MDSLVRRLETNFHKPSTTIMPDNEPFPAPHRRHSLLPQKLTYIQIDVPDSGFEFPAPPTSITTTTTTTTSAPRKPSTFRTSLRPVSTSTSRSSTSTSTSSTSTSTSTSSHNRSSTIITTISTPHNPSHHHHHKKTTREFFSTLSAYPWMTGPLPSATRNGCDYGNGSCTGNYNYDDEKKGKKEKVKKVKKTKTKKGRYLFPWLSGSA